MQIGAEERQSNGLLYLVVAVLVCATGISVIYGLRERQQTRELSATNTSLSASLENVQSQLQSVNDRLNQLSTAAPAPSHAVAPSAAPPNSRPKPKAKSLDKPVQKPRSVQTPRDDPRWEQIQARLSDQQSQIASTREDLEKSRQELTGNLDSTRSDLSGSIARTHDELIALEKRGERNYYEFTLDKSKQFRRVGSLNLSLRKANTKRKSYDVAMLVDDNQLQKKSINLYEPVWIRLSDRPQPLELVVNKIDKDHIQGYVSEPKYKQSELDGTASAPRPVQQ